MATRIRAAQSLIRIAVTVSHSLIFIWFALCQALTVCALLPVTFRQSTSSRTFPFSARRPAFHTFSCPQRRTSVRGNANSAHSAFPCASAPYRFISFLACLFSNPGLTPVWTDLRRGRQHEARDLGRARPEAQGRGRRARRGLRRGAGGGHQGAARCLDFGIAVPNHETK
jgi:hypothetical protein